MVMTNSMGQYGFGADTSVTTTTRKRQRFTSKGRSSRTYQNKIKKMKKLYKRLYRASQKKKAKNPQGRYFCDKYPTCDLFLKSIKIKEVNIRK